MDILILSAMELSTKSLYTCVRLSNILPLLPGIAPLTLVLSIPSKSAEILFVVLLRNIGLTADSEIVKLVIQVQSMNLVATES